MSAEYLLRALSYASLQSSLLMCALLALLMLMRPVLRALGGAGAVYFAWVALPLGLAAAWIPAPSKPMPIASEAVVNAMWEVRGPNAWLPGAVVVHTYGKGRNTRLALGAAWAVGALGLGCAILVRQRRWLSKVQPGVSPRLPAGESPGVVGLLQPRVVLPLDFEQRFSVIEQRLVLAHEAVHARRRDNLWSLIAVALVCLHWFNPLAWWALGRFRSDQELACDEAALRLSTAGDRNADCEAYQSALLKAHDLNPASALACPWASGHPLIERLKRLPRKDVAAVRRHGAKLLAMAASLLMVGAVFATHGAQTYRGPAFGNLADSRMQLTTWTQLDGGPWKEEIVGFKSPMTTFTGYDMYLGRKSRHRTITARLDPLQENVTIALADADGETLLADAIHLERGERKRIEAMSSAGHPLRFEFELR